MVGFELERHVPFPPEDTGSAGWSCRAAPTRRGVSWWRPPAAGGGAAARPAGRGQAPARRHHGGLPRAARAPSRVLPAQRAVWAHRHGTRTDLLLLMGRTLLMSRSVDHAARGLAREIPRSLGLVSWTGCEAVWISGDDAGRLARRPRRVARRPGLRSAVRRDPESPRRALPATERGRPCSRSAWPRSRGPPLDLLPVELRPWTLSRAQLVTAGMASVTALLGSALAFTHTIRPSATSGG